MPAVSEKRGRAGEENEDDSGAFADDELDIDENMLYAISKNTCMLHNSLKNFAAKETSKTHNSLVALEPKKILSQMTKQNILSSQLLLTKIGENTNSIENLVYSTLTVAETVLNSFLKNNN